MSGSSSASTIARVVSYAAVVITILVALGLLLAGVIAFQLIAGEPTPGGGFAFLFIASWLLLLGILAVIIGGVGMKLAGGNLPERKRGWHAIALGLVALAIGATFGVGFA